MRKRIGLSWIFLTFFTGCYKDHLYVQQEWVDRNFLASTKVNTPDPRQVNPPEGQRLLVSWKFPDTLFCQNLKLALNVRFWDQTEETLSYPIKKARSYKAFYFPQKKILTYRVQVLNSSDEILETWEHHFWTQWIDLSSL